MADATRAARPSLAGLYGLARRAPARLLEFLRDREDLWPAEAVLCLAAWLTEEGGRPHVTPLELRRVATEPDVRGLVPRVKAPADALRSCAESGLMESVVPEDQPSDSGIDRATRRARRPTREPWYRLTPLGRAVVDALPDRRRVAALRGLKTTARAGVPGPTRRITPTS
jgi:hypothetical protein